MLFPDIETVKDLLKSYKTVPVFYELLVDQFTPIRLFNCLHEKYNNCFILESVDNKDQWGRYSYVGIDPKEEIIINGKTATVKKADGTRTDTQINDPRDFLQGILDEHRSPKINGCPKLTGGLIGYFAYDCVRYYEKTLTSPPADDLKMNDIDLHLFDELVAYDHLSNK
ncbi:MAG: anthranilate synthase component I, partial [Ruminococcus sp.]|nr:anthranilate synthase component I [Ruminococcus sp.]